MLKNLKTMGVKSRIMEIRRTGVKRKGSQEKSPGEEILKVVRKSARLP